MPASTVLAPESMPRRVELLSYMPLCHVFEKLFTLSLALELGATVNFAESIDTVREDLAEIQPTFFPAPPRIWEKMQAGVMVKMSDASLLKRWCFDLFLKAGRPARRGSGRGRSIGGQGLAAISPGSPGG